MIFFLQVKWWGQCSCILWSRRNECIGFFFFFFSSSSSFVFLHGLLSSYNHEMKCLYTSLETCYSFSFFLRENWNLLLYRVFSLALSDAPGIFHRELALGKNKLPNGFCERTASYSRIFCWTVNCLFFFVVHTTVSSNVRTFCQTSRVKLIDSGYHPTFLISLFRNLTDKVA